MLPQPAPRATQHDLLHGVTVDDPYRWLEDLADDRTQAWRANQHDRYVRTRATWQHLKAWSYSLTESTAAERRSVPVVRGDRTFYLHINKDSEQPALYVSEDGADRMVVDPLIIDPSGNTILEDWCASIEGDLLAYQLSVHGDEDCALFIQDVATGRLVEGPIDRVRRTPVAWLPKGEFFYYVRRLPPELRPEQGAFYRRIYLHEVGTDPARDVVIFGDDRQAAQFYTVAVTMDGRWLTVSASVGSAPHNELWLADLHLAELAHPQLRPVHVDYTARTHTRIAPRTAADDPMWLRTTLAAPRGRVVATTPGDPGPETWTTIIAERADAVLKDFVPLTGKELSRPVALVAWLRHGVCELTLNDLADGRKLGSVTLPGLGSVGPLQTNPWPSHEAWFSYSDYVTSSNVLQFDGRSGRLQTLFASSVDQLDCRTIMATATSHDGTPVQVFIVSPAGAPDRPRPTILTGYGGFGASMTPSYSNDIVAWVRAGGVYAVACLRGGGEGGVEWHRAGMGRNKQRVFDDFDAVTDLLLQQEWTTAAKLGILGNSNGGLLVAAALTQHPEKYGAVASVAPLTDMIRYEKSGMGPSWRAEYGTVDDPDDFAALIAYSPYHNVREGRAYPPTLVGAFEEDSRVDPSHARKFAAALQHVSTSPVLVRMEDNAGHGARATSRMVGLQADLLAFFSHHLGLRPEVDRCECSSAH